MHFRQCNSRLNRKPMDLKNEIRDILIGWKNDLITTPEIKEMSERRMEICRKCPHIALNVIVRCGLCNCPLSKMLKVPNRSCKDNRWGPEDAT